MEDQGGGGEAPRVVVKEINFRLAFLCSFGAAEARPPPVHDGGRLARPQLRRLPEVRRVAHQPGLEPGSGSGSGHGIPGADPMYLTYQDFLTNICNFFTNWKY
jgi:hypothetical protein